MFHKRFEDTRKKLNRQYGKLDIRTRHSELLAVEGWYSVHVGDDAIPAFLLLALEEYRKSKSKVKLTRWLLRKGKIDLHEAAYLGTVLSNSKIDFKISCRHNDFLRMADTKHYTTCFKDWRGAQQLRYLTDPDLALVYVPDNAGKFKWRALLRLVFNPDGNGYAFALYQDYGNTIKKPILDKLDSIYPLYVLRKRSSDRIFILSSPTKHNNPIVGFHVWSDHWCKMNEDKRLQVRGIKYSTEKILK